MKRAMRLGMALAAGLLAAAAHAAPQRIGWPDLLGASRRAANPALAGHEIELLGYLLPIDREGDKVYEFMLVPTPGACSHGPQPPPNQIVRVSLREPFAAAGIYEPVSVRGTLRAGTEKAQLFMIDGLKVVETAYSIGAAQVRSEGAPPPLFAGNPLLKHGK